MDKRIGGLLVLAMFAVFVMPVGAQNEVYLVPQDSTASYGNTADVEIWVNVTETGFQSGQINLTYDSTCADVTTWERNTTNFGMGGREHYEGREWLTFTAMAPLPDGEYQVGTLTIQCVNDSQGGCEMALDIVDSSSLFNDIAYPVTATWIDGTFRGSPTTDPIPEFPTLAIPVAAIIGLLLLIRRRRHE